MSSPVALPLAMDAEPDDIVFIARWAITAFGVEAVSVIRRRAAENLLAEEPEAAETWQRVADVAGEFLCGRHLH